MLVSEGVAVVEIERTVAFLSRIDAQLKRAVGDLRGVLNEGLERQDASGAWIAVNSDRTGPDGRCEQLLPHGEFPAGLYRLVFDTASYFRSCNLEALYPVVEVTFEAREGDSRFHIPLLLSPNGYTTYRGS